MTKSEMSAEDYANQFCEGMEEPRDSDIWWYAKQGFSAGRLAGLEEGAKVAESYGGPCGADADLVAAAIRSLKDKE